MCLLYGAAYDVPAVALRFFNVYGPRQALSNPYTGVLAIFAARLLNDHAPVVYEDGGQRRDFVHVADVARACRLALERDGADGQPVNVGSGQSTSVLEIAETLARLLGKQIEPELPGQVPRRRHPPLLRRCHTRARGARLRGRGRRSSRAWPSWPSGWRARRRPTASTRPRPSWTGEGSPPSRYSRGMAAGATATLRTGDLSLSYAPLGSVENVERLPYSLRILLENALRFESESGVEAVAQWQPQDEPSRELGFRPSRVLLQDFTGVPAIVDVAAMRSAMADLGGDPAKINPHIPAELVIDHSVQVDAFATRMAISTNVDRDYERNGERYAFLRWGQGAFDNLKVVPPNTGIVHQVNLEYLARVIEERDGVAFPDTLVGTDSHTTMVNGLGVLGWGVGGIEAEAALLGEELSMLVPQVVGVRLDGRLREGATATDLVLTITELLRKTGVVGKFVEYFGARARRPRAGRPRDAREHVARVRRDLRLLPGRRPDARLPAPDRPARGAGRASSRPTARRTCSGTTSRSSPSTRRSSSSTSTRSSRASPARAARRTACRSPTRRTPSSTRSSSFGHGYGNGTIDKSVEDSFPASDPASFQEPGPHTMDPEVAQVATKSRPHLHVAKAELDGEEIELQDGSVVIAAITSCTNTSNPQVMLGAALLAKKAVERGLQRKPWVKSSLAPGSRVVTDYYDKAGLTPYLEQLGFNTVGYGCTTCIGNSGPLPEPISAAVEEGDLVVCSVLSGNRNFEARIHPEVKANYLASPPLVVAYALAGRMDVDLETEPLGQGSDGEDVFLRDLWPTNEEIDAGGRGRARRRHVPQAVRRRLHRRRALAGAARSPRATSTTGATSRPTSAGRRSSRACRASPSRCRTSRARAASSRSATASPPTTSRPPARSSPRARPASG